jgi:hypothetical protein
VPRSSVLSNEEVIEGDEASNLFPAEQWVSLCGRRLRNSKSSALR